MSVGLHSVPEERRAEIGALLDDLFPGSVDQVEAGPSGASGASTFRVRGAAGDHLLRIEGSHLPGRNPHQYRNLTAAAEAGIAPPVLHVDDGRGLLVMRWIDVQPLTDFPGGAVGLVRAAGELVGRLQGLDPFPAHEDWADVIGQMLGFAGMTGAVDASIVERISSAYDRIRAAWPRDPARWVPAHNDPNASNILFDGERLWLVDWETSAPNDPLVDLAVVANQLAPDPSSRDELLTAWRGSPPDDVLRARLNLAQLSAQLFAGCAISLVLGPMGGEPVVDLDAPTPEAFQAQVMDGTLVVGTPETMTVFAKLVLAQFVQRAAGPDFERALAVSAAG